MARKAGSVGTSAPIAAPVVQTTDAAPVAAEAKAPKKPRSNATKPVVADAVETPAPAAAQAAPAAPATPSIADLASRVLRNRGAAASAMSSNAVDQNLSARASAGADEFARANKQGLGQRIAVATSDFAGSMAARATTAASQTSMEDVGRVGGSAINKVVDVVKENPIAATAVGAGVLTVGLIPTAIAGAGVVAYKAATGGNVSDAVSGAKEKVSGVLGRLWNGDKS